MKTLNSKAHHNYSKLTKVQLIEKLVQKEADAARKEQLLRSCKSESVAQQKTIASLEKEVKNLNEELAKTKGFKTKTAEKDKKIKEQKAELLLLKKEKRQEETIIESVGKAHASFHLDFYVPDKGKLAGKVFHPLSKKQLSLKGLEGEKIINFIRNYLPELEKEVSVPINKKVKKKSEAKLSPKTTKTAQTNLQKKEDSNKFQNLMITTTTENDMELRTLDHSGNFKVKLTFDAVDLEPMVSQNLKMDISIYAKGLDNSNNTLISKQINLDPPEKELDFKVYPNILRPGMYRISATLNVKDEKADGRPMVYFNDGDLIHVF